MSKSVTNWILLLFLVPGSSLLAQSISDKPVLVAPPSKPDLVSADAPDTSTDTPSIGYIDTPTAITTSDLKSSIQGWALDLDGIAKVKLRIDGKNEINISHGLIRNDVAKVYPGYPDADKAGFASRQDLSKHLTAHSQIDVIVVDKNDVETIIGSRFVVMSDKMNQWQTLYNRNPQWVNDPFYFLHATSAASTGGANGLSQAYESYVSPTMRIGLRVPILYMRTTLGKDKDWLFDPDFDTSKTFNNKRLVDDSLQTLIDYAVSEKLAVSFTLNGGIWADSAGTTADWDLNDHLEEDPLNCQWSQYDEVFADDYLKGLTGSTESPELARVLTLNAFAEDVHRYKKRNLQAAGKLILRFQQQHPELFVGIGLDADTYANPFFDDRWHDYNPDTIRQFRQWLQGTGLYGSGGVLESYRRTDTLDLQRVNKLAETNFNSWDQVDPPRNKPAKSNLLEPDRLTHWWLTLKSWFVDSPPSTRLSLEQIAKQKVPWIKQWEMFRRHLIDLHYDDLSIWLTEAGINSRDIYSSQGFSAPHSAALPFAVHLDSPVKNYDSGGMSVEGSVPRNGHLGVIIYGESSANNIRMETKGSLFEAFYRADPNWGIVEYSTSDFKNPENLADYALAYRSLRDVYNYQSRFLSAMAWNGSNGKMVGKPGFAAHTALRETPMELAMKDFMVSRAYLPRSALMWEFGTHRHLDYDHWKASTGTIEGNYGSLIVKASKNQASLVSPSLITIEKRHDLLILGIKQTAAIRQIEVFSQSNKQSLSGPLDIKSLTDTTAGIEIPLEWGETETQHGFEIIFTFGSVIKQFQLDHVVLLPNSVADNLKIERAK
ncbi:MAG: hypothetical protein V3U88_04200 [Methylococcales bacterium]